MTLLAEDRTISMILTVPDANELFTDSIVDQSPVPSIPIYHGSIIRIEPHEDDENISDLIVRVPNFHHLALPSVTITINENQGETKHKRRAPICPIMNGKISNVEHATHSGFINPKRIAIGLRNLRRAILTNTKSKQTKTINEITIVPVLPDVEVISEDIQIPIITKKSHKHSATKFFQPRILSIKRKYLKIYKKHQPSADSTDTQTEKTDEQEKNPSVISIDSAAELPSLPISISDLPQSEEGVYVVDENGDTYSECYEVTYEFDRNFQSFNFNEQQIDIPKKPERIPIEINFISTDYEDLAAAYSHPLAILPANNYEQIDNEYRPRVKFQLDEHLVPTSTYQSEIISTFPSSSIDTLSVCPDDAAIINESYTVLVELLKHALQLESIPSEENINDFNQQILELSSTIKI